MDAAEFRALVRQTFGPRLERATPANVAEFAARLQDETAPRWGDGRYLLGADVAESYEGAVKQFLVDSLESEPETARQALWLALLELWFSVIEVEASERFGRLFDDLSPDAE